MDNKLDLITFVFLIIGFACVIFVILFLAVRELF